MRVLRILSLAGATAAILAAGSIGARANLVLNGSFENGLANIGQFTTINSVNSTSNTDWTVAHG